jgi:predicted nucleotidyltransferase component of viral defense system
VFGHSGRFSVDLDFTISDRHYGEYVLDALVTGFTHEGVSFHASERIDTSAVKTAWRATTPTLGESRLQSRLDFSTRELLLAPTNPTQRKEIASIDQNTLGFAPVLLPLAALEETAAEKLARFRRIVFARDLYDLCHLIPLVRERRDVIKDVLFFKVWGDVVEDDRGSKPFHGGVEFRARTPDDVQGAQDIGTLTSGPLDLDAMLHLVEDTFSVIGGPIGEQQEVLAQCQSYDRFRVLQRSDEFRSRMATSN